MADNNCNPCKDSVFKKLSSRADFSDLIEYIDTNSSPDVDVVGDDSFIFVEETLAEGIKTFTVRYQPYLPLVINSFTDDLSLQLKGTTVTDFNLSWVYNKPVESQSLDQGLTAPNATINDDTYNLAVTGQSITANTTIVLTADDITADAIPAKTASNTITFGNYIYQTQIAISDRSNIDSTLINTIDLNLITKTLTTNKNITFTCSSDVTEYEALFVPTSFNVAGGGSFQDQATNFTGGWSKLLTLSLTNSAGFSENYDIFISSNKNLNGLTFKVS